jgi:uncharacterized membrane protein YeiH
MTATRSRFHYNPDYLLLAVDLLGTLVFAIEGALAAIKGDLDFFGLMVLSFITAVGGGIVRDLLIGDVPPNSIRDWRYGVTAFAGGATVFFFYERFQQIPSNLLMVLDAAGLSLFAVAGVGKALEYKIHPFVAILMGCITGVGGGTIRDLLLAQVPTVLRADVYASAALTGAAVMIAGLKLRLPRVVVMTLGGIVCFVLRVVSVWQAWQLPRVLGR